MDARQREDSILIETVSLAAVGAKLGDAWDRDPMLKATFQRFDMAIVIAVLLAAGALVWHRLRGAFRS